MNEDVAETLALLKNAEAHCRGSAADLAKLEQEYERAAESLNQVPAFLSQRNRFRVKNASAMGLKRPKVLYGRYPCAPNFHALPLLQTADVIFLSLFGRTQGAIDSISIDPFCEDINDIVRALPEGFHPDVYFDYQVCSTDVFIRGMETAPFPTVASLCHHFRCLKIEEIANLFDFVLPLSKTFSMLMAETIDSRKIIDLPFGLSWGSFHHIVSSPAGSDDRNIDVLLTFDGQSGAGYGPYRSETVGLFEAAQAELGHRYKFVKSTGISRSDYLNLMCRSKIVLNVVGIHGPYNYRTCEAINAGALLMQYDVSYATGPQHLESYLEPDEELVLFDRSNFQSKLNNLLEDKSLRVGIASRAQGHLRSQYSYNRLYEKLFSAVAKADRASWIGRRLSKPLAAASRVYAYLQNDDTRSKSLAALDLADAISASNVHPAALLLPFYKSVGPVSSSQTLEGIVGPLPQSGTDAEKRLGFYDAALRAISRPSVVDTFNYIVLCAEDGQVDLEQVQKLIKKLSSSALKLDKLEILRICSAPKVPGVSKAAAEHAEIMVRNMAHLFAAANRSLRQAAARDFMLIWLYWILGVTAEDGEAWKEAAADLVSRYPIVASASECAQPSAFPIAS